MSTKLLKTKFFFILVILLFCSLDVLSDVKAEVKEEKKAPGLDPQHPFFSCAVCHGNLGEGNEELFAPRLSGQHIGYLKQQIESFQKGWRGRDSRDTHGQIMAGAIAAMKQETIDSAIRYLETVSNVTPIEASSGDQWRGGMLYKSNCAICHGDKGEGMKEYNMAKLNVQHGWYLEKQITFFREGVRGEHKKDEMGKTMAFYAKLLPDEKAVQDVVSWITHTSTKSYAEKK